MSNFAIRTAEGSEGTRILAIEGALTLQTVFEFQDLIRTTESPRLILDLSAVPYMDSAGLGAVLGAFVSSQRKGRRFALASVPPRIVTLLEVANVEKMLPRYESPAAADAALAKAQSA